MCHFCLRALTQQIINQTRAAIRITGSASMNTGVVPYVNVTIVDDRMISAIPDVRIIRPLFKRLNTRLDNAYATAQITKPIAGYIISVLRDIEPEALPCRSKCAGNISGREVQRMKTAAALTATIKNGIIQPRLELDLEHSFIGLFF